ncbi:type II toxin-antitoxin system VapC family toxin [Microcoleus sp. FACHB-672]|uniref:type II toxin-antitoxin system VapC family toxin n=1 Tax=Microcoleus sp. FACHB-672 TaxID=2692825 RepID=UPI001682F253|nr:PIN domain-containing protein [Microcoleus sp. FACHB-672]MBD2040205.1 PIN domain-containing protein [Microcoleus sp. FACHB-672]
MRVLVDTNIVLDYILDREPFAAEASTLLEYIASGEIEGYVAATTLTNIFYIVRRATRSLERAKHAVSDTLTLMEICSVDQSILERAFAFNLNDFEDAVQIACALANNIDAIITRDAQDFVDAPLLVLSAGELLNTRQAP